MSNEKIQGKTQVERCMQKIHTIYMGESEMCRVTRTVSGL